MFKISCKELTNKECDFVSEGETAEEAKANFYKHGAESPLHKEAYENATDEEKANFSKKVDEYLGNVEVYYHNLEISIPFVAHQKEFTFIIEYQGCAEAGLCYPPEEKKIQLFADKILPKNDIPSLRIEPAAGERPIMLPVVDDMCLLEIECIGHCCTPHAFEQRRSFTVVCVRKTNDVHHAG